MKALFLLFFSISVLFNQRSFGGVIRPEAIQCANQLNFIGADNRQYVVTVSGFGNDLRDFKIIETESHYSTKGYKKTKVYNEGGNGSVFEIADSGNACNYNNIGPNGISEKMKEIY